MKNQTTKATAIMYYCMCIYYTKLTKLGGSLKCHYVVTLPSTYMYVCLNISACYHSLCGHSKTTVWAIHWMSAGWVGGRGVAQTTKKVHKVLSPLSEFRQYFS